MSPRDSSDPAAPFDIAPPEGPPAAMVIASPHSGRRYPLDLLEAARLDSMALRRSEDAFVDEIFADAPGVGIALIRALFPRAYVDVNREPWELDPAMFEDDLPDWVNRNSPRVRAGLGTIARIVGEGMPIYRRKLRFAEAQSRVEQFYAPYHAALDRLVADNVARFGVCLLLDAHSMPSSAPGIGATGGYDFVLGDRMGASCDPSLMEATETLLRQRGYRVIRNKPYAGGYTTKRHGQPAQFRHCLQIEINRALYMDERNYTRAAGLAEIRGIMKQLMEKLTPLVGLLPKSA